MAHGLMFHRLHREGELPAGQGSFTGREFERILLAIGPGNFLTPDAWLERMRRGTLRDSDRCVTFEGAMTGQYEVAIPVLDRLGIRAFFFVYSSVFEGRPDRSELAQYAAARHFESFADFAREFVGRARPLIASRLGSEDHVRFGQALRRLGSYYSDLDVDYRYARNRALDRAQFERIVDEVLADHGLDPREIAARLWLDDAQLRELADAGHCIGLHSYDHPCDIGAMSVDEQREQYERNRAHVERATGVAARTMSHPYNSYDARTLEILRSLGIECGFRLDAPGATPLNRSPLEMARLDAGYLRG